MNRAAGPVIAPADAHVLRLLGRAVNGVMGHAQAGDLPLSAWTLGLPQDELCALLSFCFPELEDLERLPAHQYDTLMRQASWEQRQLVQLLLAQRTVPVVERHAHWTAHVVAAAAQGSRHLWEDMGLGGREEVSTLLQYFFAPFCERNVAHLKWKRFMFDQLALMHPDVRVRKPDCTLCKQQLACFPTEFAELTKPA
ncbi:hydrogenase [Pseudoduganella sp. FT93W]|uniref:Hydrogenase n=1 Tax=Duganella fentianensis TaxID=2692177 RepID=A0A845HUT1_9BURK|nr:nitrogen fixation protein NifQ [Duganella fentianensis]MYN44820.1 hydrogenase [Duganella fentianensis]